MTRDGRWALCAESGLGAYPRGWMFGRALGAISGLSYDERTVVMSKNQEDNSVPKLLDDSAIGKAPISPEDTAPLGIY